ncbi:hypothetical protein BRC62_03920 [Halobacteriales archaeon QH_10_67_13]|nr:MAG: hypothetical protein BRC62_03920 [Halobacteriales archaeon QH_10_67_13]
MYVLFDLLFGILSLVFERYFNRSSTIKNNNIFDILAWSHTTNFLPSLSIAQRHIICFNRRIFDSHLRTSEILGISKVQ